MGVVDQSPSCFQLTRGRDDGIGKQGREDCVGKRISRWDDEAEDVDVIVDDDDKKQKQKGRGRTFTPFLSCKTAAARKQRCYRSPF